MKTDDCSVLPSRIACMIRVNYHKVNKSPYPNFLLLRLLQVGNEVLFCFCMFELVLLITHILTLGLEGCFYWSAKQQMFIEWKAPDELEEEKRHDELGFGFWIWRHASAEVQRTGWRQIYSYYKCRHQFVRTLLGSLRTVYQRKSGKLRNLVLGHFSKKDASTSTL